MKLYHMHIVHVKSIADVTSPSSFPTTYFLSGVNGCEIFFIAMLLSIFKETGLQYIEFISIVNLEINWLL